MDMMVQVDPKKYGPNVDYEKVKEVLYIGMLIDIYGMLKSDLLSYIKLRKYLDTDIFKFNPHEYCSM